MSEFKSDDAMSAGHIFNVLFLTIILLLLAGVGLFIFKRKMLSSNGLRKNSRVEIVELKTQYRLGDIAIVKIDSTEFLIISNKNGINMSRLESEKSDVCDQTESAG